jgi:hypothetical protein
MNTSELIQHIKSAGFYPILVEGDADRNESSAWRFVGTLQDFFEAAKAMGATVIFFFVWKLDEEDFHYDSDCSEESDFDDSDEEQMDSNKPREDRESFDLTLALPSIVNFKKHIGQDGMFLLTAKSQLDALSFRLAEDWWTSFGEQRDKARQKVDEDREAIREKMEKQQLQKEENLLKQVRSLIDDPEFSRISTQRDMKAYALEKFPELEGVDESSLTKEIQKLNDKILARKKRKT